MTALPRLKGKPSGSVPTTCRSRGANGKGRRKSCPLLWRDSNYTPGPVRVAQRHRPHMAGVSPTLHCSDGHKATNATATSFRKKNSRLATMGIPGLVLATVGCHSLYMNIQKCGFYAVYCCSCRLEQLGLEPRSCCSATGLLLIL